MKQLLIATGLAIFFSFVLPKLLKKHQIKRIADLISVWWNDSISWTKKFGYTLGVVCTKFIRIKFGKGPEKQIELEVIYIFCQELLQGKTPISRDSHVAAFAIGFFEGLRSDNEIKKKLEGNAGHYVQNVEKL